MTDIKTILITGAGSGVGRATATHFLDQGHTVALLGRRKDALEQTASLSGEKNALVIPCDVTNEDEVKSAFAKTVTKFGRLDVLFNNAGGGLGSTTIDEVSLEDWQQVVDVNLTGAFLCAREAFRIMRNQTPQGGRIINNGSISAYVPRPGSIAYSTTKHAITGLTRTLSLDGRPFDIACGQIDIGNAESPLTEKMPKGVPQANGAVAAEPVMDVKHVAKSVYTMAELPLDANIQFMTVMATKMPYIGRG